LLGPSWRGGGRGGGGTQSAEGHEEGDLSKRVTDVCGGAERSEIDEAFKTSADGGLKDITLRPDEVEVFVALHERGFEKVDADGGGHAANDGVEEPADRGGGGSGQG
jgi:hypothetical protein